MAGETKITAEQKNVLINFMEDHEDFAKGKLLGPDGRKTRSALWEVLATQLNACDGPKKSTVKWQRVWVDLKNKIKKKAGEIKKSRLATGSGPQTQTTLSDCKIKVVDFLSKDAVRGLSGIDGLQLDSAALPQASSSFGVVDEEMVTDHDYTLCADSPAPPLNIISSNTSEDDSIFSPSVGSKRK